MDDENPYQTVIAQSGQDLSWCVYNNGIFFSCYDPYGLFSLLNFREMDTISGKATLSKLCSLPSENGSAL